MDVSKVILILIGVFAFMKSFGQIKLCEEDSQMYSICYYLEPHGTFTYEFNHCTGSTIGTGIYRRVRKGLIFCFDTLMLPEVRRLKAIDFEQKVSILMFDFVSREPYSFFFLKYQGKVQSSDGLNKIILDYEGGPIVVYNFKPPLADSIIVNPEIEDCNSYQIDWCYPSAYMVKAGKIVKMKKIGNKYRLKEESTYFNEKKNRIISRSRVTYYIEEE